MGVACGAIVGKVAVVLRCDGLGHEALKVRADQFIHSVPELDAGLLIDMKDGANVIGDYHRRWVGLNDGIVDSLCALNVFLLTQVLKIANVGRWRTFLLDFLDKTQQRQRATVLGLPH